MNKIMKRSVGYLLGVAVMLVAMSLAGCATSQAATEAEGEPPAKVERLEGKVPTREILTEDAAKRIDLQTAKVNDDRSVPYSAILYDINGNTWLYTSPEALTFERTPVVVDHIDGDAAFLSDGPPAGTMVVSRGVAELYGAETEFAEE